MVSVAAPEKLQLHLHGLVVDGCCRLNTLGQCLCLLKLWSVALQLSNKFVDFCIELCGVVLDPFPEASPDLNSEVNCQRIIMGVDTGSREVNLQAIA